MKVNKRPQLKAGQYCSDGYHGLLRIEPRPLPGGHIWERGIGPSGAAELLNVGPQATDNQAEIYEYWRRRRARDPDLWVIELDIAQAERFAAETMSEG